MVLEYNYFFYPNACHICKKFGEEISLKRCGNCTMISYCSKKHQKEHWLQHKDLCNAICSVLKDNQVSSFLNNKQNLNTEGWTEMKMNFMLLVAIKIGRKLKHYEEEMFKFIRSCAVCHEQNVKVLEDCPNCPNTSFCTKHKNDMEHKKICYLIKLCYTLDLASITYKEEIPKMRVPSPTNHISLPQNIKDLIHYYIEPHTISPLSIEEETMIHTEYLTRPLTLLYALQKLRYSLKNHSIVIHVIAANIIDIDGIEFGEILLHWYPNMETAKIVLIGPELSSGSMPINLCKICLYNNKQLLIEMHGILYDDFAKSISYVKPDIIIGYNAGIHECEDFKSENDTWRQSLQIIAKQECPFILTSYTLLEAKKEQERLNTVLGRDIECAFCDQNPYSSLRPYRDFETERVYYQNQYLLIYANLKAL